MPPLIRRPPEDERRKHEQFLAEEGALARDDREWERRRFEPYEGFGPRAMGELVERQP